MLLESPPPHAQLAAGGEAVKGKGTGRAFRKENNYTLQPQPEATAALGSLRGAGGAGAGEAELSKHRAPHPELHCEVRQGPPP